jgi:mRNA interferase MazF
VSRADVWLYRFAKPDKRRPVLVLSRQDAIDVLATVMVAPITSTQHGIDTEIPLDAVHGLKGPCAVNLDHVHTVPKSELRRYVTTLSPSMMSAVCRALGLATGCA